MRLKSEVWVQAYLKSLSARGVAAYVVRRGDADAGAIYIRIDHLDGTSLLFGPAPAGVSTGLGDRALSAVLGDDPQSNSAIEAYLEDEMRLDPDIWVIEVEARDGRHFLDDWLAG